MATAVAPKIAYTPHPKQAEFHASPARFRVGIASRQSGKSVAAIAEESEWAMAKPGGIFWWVTASYKVKDRAWRGLATHLPKEIVRHKREGDLYIELKNGSRIYIKSADAPESLVSEILDGLVCDEFAQWKATIWQQHLEPMLVVKKAPAVFVGTPRGRNWAWDLWRHAGVDPDWSAHHWTALDSPYFPREEFERLRREMPERIFRQEILAEFLEGGGEVFRNVDGCVGPLGVRDGYTVLGVDLAKVRDWTAIHALNSQRMTVETQRMQRVDWSLQKLRIIETYRRLDAVRALVDATGVGDPIVEDLRKAGLQVEPVVFTGPLKSALVENLMLLFEQGAIRIPQDPILIDELKGFTFETLPSGRDRYSAPDGRHDDTVMALALAAWGLRHLAPEQLLPGRPLTELERMRKDVLTQVMREQDPDYEDGADDGTGGYYE